MLVVILGGIEPKPFAE